MALCLSLDSIDFGPVCLPLFHGTLLDSVLAILSLVAGAKFKEPSPPSVLLFKIPVPISLRPYTVITGDTRASPPVYFGVHVRLQGDGTAPEQNGVFKEGFDVTEWHCGSHALSGI